MIYISLGWNCSPAIIRKNTFKQSKLEGYNTCPFDLCITPYQSLVDCLKTDFSNFFNLRIENEIIMNEYNMWFNHEAPTDLYSDNNFYKFKQRYEKRIQNFKSYLDGSYEVCFIHSDPFNPSTEICKIIENSYPNLIFKILSIHYDSIDVYRNHFSLKSDCKTHANMDVDMTLNILEYKNTKIIFNCNTFVDLNVFLTVQSTCSFLDLKSNNFGDGITPFLFNNLSNKELNFIIYFK